MEVSLSIDNMSDGLSKVISSEISGLLIVLLNYNINNKTTTGIFITDITNINKKSIIKFSVFDYNCVSK